MILQTFFYLALALLERSKVSHRSEDAIYAAKYLRHLWDQPHQAFGVPRAFLVEALAFQVELEAENLIGPGEMVVLYRELLTLDSSVGPRSTIGSTHRVPASGEKYKAYLRSARFAFASCLSIRYSRVFGNDDYEEGFSSGNNQGDSEFVTKAQCAMHRFHSFGPIVSEPRSEHTYRGSNSPGPRGEKGNHVKSKANRTALFFRWMDVAEGSGLYSLCLLPDSLLEAVCYVLDGTTALRDTNTAKLFLTKNNLNYSETLPGSSNPSYAQRP
ncbi:hypothetical protein EDB83DRAFT_2316044 [Lactarius deliciosus]|nr:hypothetical protein EDB83DRAFT_2316044 [Lactarius deliciosus]